MRNLALAVLAWVFLVGATARAADDKTKVNTIKKVSVKGGTVEIVGTQKPSFTTFPMSDPPRFVIDISEAVFSGVPEDVPVTGTGRITAVKTASYGDNASAIARVVIGFDRDVEPDVQASGNSLVVKVGAGSASAVATRSEPAPAKPAVPETRPTAPDTTMQQGRALVAAATAGPATADDQASRDALARANAAKQESDRKAAEAQAAAVAEQQRQAEVARQRQAIADAEAQRKAKEQAEHEARARAEAERKAQDRARADAQARAEAERKAQEKAAADAAARAETQRKAEEAAAAAAAAKVAAEQKAREDAARAEAERKAREQAAAEQRAQEQAAREAAARAEADRKAQEEAARVAAANAAAEQKARENAARAETQRKAREEAAAVAAAKAAADQKAREDAARAEAQRRAQEEAPRAAAARETERKPQQLAQAEAPRPAAREATDARGAAASTPSTGGGEVSARRKLVTMVGFAPDKSRVYVRTNEPVRYSVSQADDKTVILELENTTFQRNNDRRPLDTRFFGGPVMQITPGPVGGKTVRLAVTLRDKVEYQARQDGNEVSLQFAP
ncbi:MAG TPA: AMIN domain-containing protein [Myxococcaceae bacterium]|nr:AMIN domain-containing protein [Myxococcaceae bacterium]